MIFWIWPQVIRPLSDLLATGGSTLCERHGAQEPLRAVSSAYVPRSGTCPCRTKRSTRRSARRRDDQAESSISTNVCLRAGGKLISRIVRDSSIRARNTRHFDRTEVR